MQKYYSSSSGKTTRLSPPVLGSFFAATSAHVSPRLRLPRKTVVTVEWLKYEECTTDNQRCEWTGFRIFSIRGPAVSNRTRKEVFFPAAGSGLDFTFTQKRNWWFAWLILTRAQTGVGFLESEMIGWCFFAIRSYPVLEKWYPYPIRILFWIKFYYPYPKTIRKCILMYNIHFCVVAFLPDEAKSLLELFCL